MKYIFQASGLVAAVGAFFAVVFLVIRGALGFMDWVVATAEHTYGDAVAKGFVIGAVLGALLLLLAFMLYLDDTKK